jgi:RimJ/RimL family protein N-acetyltransferase
VNDSAATEVKLSPIDLDAERDELIAFMTSNDFPFHAGPKASPENIEQRIARGAYDDPDHAAYWIDLEWKGRVGLVVLEDLTDHAPMFDLRLGNDWRGQGIGTAAVAALTGLVFTSWPEVNRFEGQTREDNIAMRKAFLRSGFIKEAHYREGWPVPGGTPVASVAYTILRSDWRSGTTTTFVWEDLRQPVEPLQQSIGDVLGEHLEDSVIAPVPRDVQESGRGADLGEPELLDDPEAGGVLGTDRDLDAMQSGRGQQVIAHQRDSRRRDRAPGVALGDPVAEACPARGAPGDAVDGQQPDHLTVPGHDERHGLAHPRAPAQGADHADVRRGGAAGLARKRGLPGSEPVGVVRTQSRPGRGIATSQRTYADRAVVEDDRPPGTQDTPPG